MSTNKTSEGRKSLPTTNYIDRVVVVEELKTQIRKLFQQMVAQPSGLTRFEIISALAEVSAEESRVLLFGMLQNPPSELDIT